jgi:hypothetical protein
MAWTNADGLQVRFASDWASASLRKNRAGTHNSFGAIKEIEMDFDLRYIDDGTVSFSADLDNDGTMDGFYAGDVRIPAHATIHEAFIVVGEAAAGGTSIAVGLFQEDGTAIDADGLITDLDAPVANMALGDKVIGTGAFTSATAGTNGIGANDGFIGITATGTFTAGRGKLVIRYVNTQPLPGA